MNEQAAPKNDVMHKVACQIVERRNLIFLIVVILLIFSVISRSWVSVENDLTTYLPETSGTRQALDIMEEEFTTYGTADVMVANIGPERAQELADQLALSLDYAIIFSNHFREEHETLPLKESVIEALSKSIPEISSSCLTTVGGLVAMMFMQFKIGPDMAICLIKAIAYSILSVFLVMPGLLMIFGPWMEKTEHKSFVPKIPFVGRFAYKTRKIIPPVFLVLVLIAYHFSSLCPYAYGLNSIKTPKLNDVQIASNMIDENFTASNYVALVTPKADYSVEKAMITELESHDEVDSIKGLSNIEAISDALGTLKEGGSDTVDALGELKDIVSWLHDQDPLHMPRPDSAMQDTTDTLFDAVDGMSSQMDALNQNLKGVIDRLSKAGQAEPTDYETLIALENAPKRFGQITVTFKDEDHVLGRVNLEYGDSLDESGYPELPAKEGCAARWSTTKLTDLHLDTVVEAVYTDYITALASIYEREAGRPVFFAKGSFGDRDSLTVSVRDLPGELRNAVESWQLTIPDDGQESHTVRYLPLEVGKKYKVYAKQDGSWKQLSTETIGSYLAFDLPGNTAELAVVPGSSVPALGHCDRRSGRGAGRRHRSDPAQEKSTCKAGRRITAHALLHGRRKSAHVVWNGPENVRMKSTEKA